MSQSHDNHTPELGASRHLFTLFQVQIKAWYRLNQHFIVWHRRSCIFWDHTSSCVEILQTDLWVTIGRTLTPCIQCQDSGIFEFIVKMSSHSTGHKLLKILACVISPPVGLFRNVLTCVFESTRGVCGVDDCRCSFRPADHSSLLLQAPHGFITWQPRSTLIKETLCKCKEARPLPLKACSSHSYWKSYSYSVSSQRRQQL